MAGLNDHLPGHDPGVLRSPGSSGAVVKFTLLSMNLIAQPVIVRWIDRTAVWHFAIAHCASSAVLFYYPTTEYL
ncbi:hypothetical protein C0039_19735 [Pseudohalioglobus lutimaris]|uniref:Uncharacterized protein n=1 Tax=Pseudohalioglobus lutimaris TaxID=1737061 RepID=A0A2N5WX82_9GAMM|nr:hypothetical protein C0039_19735 [Pseudohalioglobus lutimaris]